MKKTISILLVLVFALSLCVVPTFAATPSQKLASAAKDAIPTHYKDRYEVIVDNVLNQISVSEEQANDVIAIINETTAKIKDKGQSLHSYTDDEKAYVLGQFDKACKVLNLTYKVIAKKNPVHKGDVIYELYYNGAKIASLDGDTAIKTTGTDVNGNIVAISLVAGVALLAAAAFVFKKSAADAE